jgi:hypothetical protein
VAEYESDNALHSCIRSHRAHRSMLASYAFLQERNDTDVIGSNNARGFVIDRNIRLQERPIGSGG